MDANEVVFAGAAAQARMLADGAITAPELLELYLDRIARREFVQAAVNSRPESFHRGSQNSNALSI